MIGLLVGLVAAVVFHVHIPGVGVHSAIFSRYLPAGAALGAIASVVLGVVLAGNDFRRE